MLAREIRRDGEAAGGKGNPSQRVDVKSKDSAECTHQLYNFPKTGSTALHNAVKTDEALKRHVCSQGVSLLHLCPR